MKLEKKHLNFPALTGVRAIAVYFVYLLHTNPFSKEKFGTFVNSFVNEFHIGVSIFFVLSGFLITHRYYDQSSFQTGWLKKYIVNRVARIYPMYFIVTTATLLLMLANGKAGDKSLFVYFMNITFLKGFFDDLKNTLVGQGWSLTVEECFYFSAPLLFLLFRKSKTLIYLLPFIFISIGALLVKIFGKFDFDGFFGSYQFMFIYTFFGRCVEFFCGIGLALFFNNQLTPEKKSIWFTFGGLALMVALVVLLSFFGDSGKSGIFSPAGIMINNFALPFSIALFFYGLIRESSLLKRILSSSLFILLGKSSYVFYLIHIGIFYQLVTEYITENYFLVFLILNLLAILLWRYIEEPLNKLIRKLN